MNNNYLNLKEVAASLNLAQSYVYTLVQQRKIPYHKPFGKKLYFKLEEIQELMEASKVSPIDESKSSQDADDFMLGRGFKDV